MIEQKDVVTVELPPALTWGGEWADRRMELTADETLLMRMTRWAWLVTVNPVSVIQTRLVSKKGEAGTDREGGAG